MQREIKITVTAPCECTEEQFKNWVEACLDTEGLLDNNPLWLFDLNPDKVEFLD